LYLAILGAIVDQEGIYVGKLMCLWPGRTGQRKEMVLQNMLRVVSIAWIVTVVEEGERLRGGGGRAATVTIVEDISPTE
jgi:hypothetical protein